jgi:hypothetical protein
VSDDKRTQSGLSAKTLLIAGVASATAAFVIPMLWRPGTVFAAAMTPIVVAIVTEMLRRPVDTVSAVRVRRTTRGAAILEPPPPEEPFDPLAPPSAEELAVLPEEHEAPRAVHRRRPLTARQWKLALTTGLVAFAAVAALFTASELLAGDALSGGGRTTTFFGGSESTKADKQPAGKKDKQEPQEKQPAATATPKETATPEATATPTPTPTVTPEATETPAPTATAPAPTP